MPAAESPGQYLTLLKDKRVALAVNHSSLIGDLHLVDFLIEEGIEIQRVFAPEHGFRGSADAGAEIKSGRDESTGIDIISLYGDLKKPRPGDLADVDIVVFDIQDVGVRFYTYISTMHYIMEACAENNKPLLILDRPNPNGYYIDGPVLEPGYRSFVGMHPIPVVYGMTIGELALMINGEGWLDGGIACDLTVIPCTNYDHTMTYDLPVAPSPNLPSHRSVLLYPSLCFFEGTVVSVGRGTNHQFQVIGHPDFAIGSYVFQPEPMPGAMHPKHEGVQCYGTSLAGLSVVDIRSWGRLNLQYLLGYYEFLAPKVDFFNPNLFFDKLAGTDSLRKQIQAGWSEEQIRSSWEEGILEFREKRARYLLY